MKNQIRSIDPITDLPKISDDQLTYKECALIFEWLLEKTIKEQDSANPELLGLLEWLLDFFDFEDELD